MRAHGIARLHHNVGLHAHAQTNEVIVDASQGEQGGDGHFVGHCPVGENDDVCALSDRFAHALVEVVEGTCQCVWSAILGIDGAEGLRSESHAVYAVNALEVVLREHGAFKANRAAVVATVLQWVSVIAKVQDVRGDHALAKCVDGWVGHLRKEFVKVVEERARSPRKDGGWRIGAHGGQGNAARLCHGTHDLFHVVEVIAMTCQPPGEWLLLVTFVVRPAVLGCRKIGQVNRLGVQPGAKRLLRGIAVA